METLMKTTFFLVLMLISLSVLADDELLEIESSIDAEYADSRVALESGSVPAQVEEEVVPVGTGEAINPQVGLTAGQTVNSAPINVDGFLKAEEKVQDHELTQIQGEIERQKKEVVLNKEKTKSYSELSRSVEALSETTEEMLEEKKAAQEQIAEYNMMVKCKSATSPGPECDKYVKRR